VALQRQIVPVPFAHGLDTKTDPKQVVQGKFLTLENGIFTSPGRIQKRNGYAAFGQDVEPGTPEISLGSGLAQFNNELLLLTGNEAYSYSDSTTRWTDKQTITNVQLSSEQVVRNTFIQNTPDSAIHPSGVQVVTYQDSRGGSRYCVIDSETGDQIVSDKLISSTAIKPKPYVIGNFILIFYIDTSSDNLMGIAIPVVTPTLPLAPRAYSLSMSVSNPNYDVTTYGSFLFVAVNSAGSGVGIFYINAFLSPSATTYQTGESASSAIGIGADLSNGQIWVAYGNGTNIKYFIYAIGFVPVLAPTIITTDVNTLNIALSVGMDVAEVFFTTRGSIPSNNFITSADLTNTGTVSDVEVFVRSVSIAGKPFTYAGFTYITTSFDTTLQPTYFTLRTLDAAVVAKFIQDDGGGTPVTNMVPEASSIQPGIYYLGTLVKDLLTTVEGVAYTQTGVNLIELDFIDAFAINAQLGGNTHITGGLLNMYDGTSIVEHGFNYFPENITYTQATSGGGIGPGTYEYFVVYSWMDAQGQTHYSAPSVGFQVIVTNSATPVTFTATFASGVTVIPVSSTAGLYPGQIVTDTTNAGTLLLNTYIVSVGTGTITISQPTQGSGAGDTWETVDTNSVTLTIPTLRLTQKKPPIRSPVSIQVYRTEDSQTIGYLVSSVTMPLLNDVTVDTVTFVDTTGDPAILGSPILYTTGGVLENIAAPAFSYITTYQDRIIGLPEENPFQWWYSKQNEVGVPVEFTDSFVNNVNQAGGNLVSALQMDSELIFFQQYQIQYITGVGPDATGNQNNFSAPLNIASDVGCSDKNSLVLTPAGIFFKSLKGIYLLPRNLTSLQYIGAGVEAYNQYDVVSADLIENTQQVRFCLSNGQALVYDYFVNEWSVFTNHPAVDSVIFQGLFTYLTEEGLVLQETPGQFTDNGNFIKLRLVTSWLSFVGLQGYQRVRNLLFLGDYFNPHNVAVYAAYDFNTSTTTQQNIIQAGNILGTGVYGSDATYGETSPYGGPPNTYQFRVPLSRQKCESIQITIEDQALYGSFGENLALSAFSFEVGIKDTLNKIVAQGTNTNTP
jgi:hypothetical protein